MVKPTTLTSLYADGMTKAKAGITTAEEVLRVCVA
jgi:type II secretory ATPase GspE/PulE/Tfp pilus assembly ATPase PilB-like protein